MLVDINILVAAARADHAQHLIAKKWMDDFFAVSQPEATLLLTMPVVAGFIRLVTNPRVFKEPTEPKEALAYIKNLLSNPEVRWVEKSSEWSSFDKLVAGKNLAGNDIPDAWLASLAVSLSEPFVTFDKGLQTTVATIIAGVVGCLGSNTTACCQYAGRFLHLTAAVKCLEILSLPVAQFLQKAIHTNQQRRQRAL